MARKSLAVCLLVGASSRARVDAFAPWSSNSFRISSSSITGTGNTGRRESKNTYVPPLKMFIEFKGRGYQDNDEHYGDHDPYMEENFRGIHSHEIPWREHMPNAANDDGTLVEPILWQYAQNGNWHEVYTRICSNPDEAVYAQMGWTPLHLLVAGNGIPAPLNVVRAVYAAFPEALHIRTYQYERTPLDIAKDWNQPQEIIEFLSDPQTFELEASRKKELQAAKEELDNSGLELLGSGSGSGSSASDRDTPLDLPGTKAETICGLGTAGCDEPIETMNNNAVIDVEHGISDDDRKQQQQEQQQHPPPVDHIAHEKRRIVTSDGLDNRWAAASGGTINGDYRPAFDDMSPGAASGEDFQPSFGDNIVGNKIPTANRNLYQPAPAPAPKPDRTNAVGSFADRPNDVAPVGESTKARTVAPEAEYDYACATIENDRIEQEKTPSPFMDYDAAPETGHTYYSPGSSVQEVGSVVTPEIEPEPVTPDVVYAEPVVQTNDDSTIDPTENSDGTPVKGLVHSNEDTVREVPDDLVCVIVDDDALEEEIHNKRIMEEVRLQQYQDDMRQQRAEEAMRQRAANSRQSQAAWGDWGARQGHSWIKFTL
mmetsp:Transcript_8099/g.17515  ORF Transcript_8099/g.17515 Transcript_8099/m.17515 type:complete len:598 (-) Transcript_8099:274-2067(-)